jgi:copper transport protein
LLVVPPPILRAMKAGPLICAILLSLLVPIRARAHGHLTRSLPAADARLHEAPRLLRLEFSEAPELAVSSVRLIAARGGEIALAPLHRAGDSLRVVIAEIAGPLQAGLYTVKWQMAGRDGHPVHGQYDFVIAEDASGVVTEPAPEPELGPSDSSPVPGPTTESVPMDTDRPGEFDSASVAYVIVRWAQFIGMLVVIGAVVFRGLILTRLPRDRFDILTLDDAAARARRLAIAGASVLGASAVARLLAQWVAMRVAAVAPSAMPLERVIWQTAWGHAWLLEVGALTTLAIGLWLVGRAGGGRTGWGFAFVATIALACSLALSGHAAASPAPLAAAVDAAHLLAAGGWMGGLFIVLTAGLPAARALPAPTRGAAGSALVNAFSQMALVFVMLLVATGFLAAWRNIESLSALVHSRYGQVLLLKLAALAVAVLIGLYNWLRARPALVRTGDDVPIQRAMRAELIAGLVVLLITAVLVAVPTPVDLVRMR